ncbi:MAG: hypothetical protein Q9221_006516 [Calogaya cf. arnoldii]
MAPKKTLRAEVSETPSPKRPRTTRAAASGKSINYDQRYHPMDDITRPAAAAARRAAHGLRDASCSSTSSDSDTIINQSDVLSDDSEDTKRAIRRPTESKSNSSPNGSSSREIGSNPSTPRSANPTHRPVRARSGSPSSRRVTRGEVNGEKVVQYSAKHHPMDDVIRPKQAKKVLAQTAAIASSSFVDSPKRTQTCKRKSQYQTVNQSPERTRSFEPEPRYEAANASYDTSLSGWKSLNDEDRLLFSLQKGARPHSLMPATWSQVAQALRKLDTQRSADINHLQQRYDTVYRSLQTHHGSADEPTTEQDQELYYAESFDVYDHEAGDKYWTHRRDNVVSSDTPARGNEFETNVKENGGDVTGAVMGVSESTEVPDTGDEYDFVDDDKNDNEDDASIPGGYGSYNDAEGYIRQSFGIFDSETQESSENKVLASLRDQLSLHLDDMLPLDELSQKFQSSVDHDNRSRSQETVQGDKFTTNNDEPTAAEERSASESESESGMIRKPLKRRFSNPRSRAQRPFSVHEDQPGNTPKIKRQVAMRPRSPGMDLPKENWSERSSSRGSSFSTQN